MFNKDYFRNSALRDLLKLASVLQSSRRLLWMKSFVWEAKVVEHALLLVRSSVDCYRPILLNTSLSE